MKIKKEKSSQSDRKEESSKSEVDSSNYDKVSRVYTHTISKQESINDFTEENQNNFIIESRYSKKENKNPSIKVINLQEIQNNLKINSLVNSIGHFIEKQIETNEIQKKLNENHMEIIKELKTASAKQMNILEELKKGNQILAQNMKSQGEINKKLLEKLG